MHILEEARNNVARQVNNELIAAYWNIGRIIVDYEQTVPERADYGKQTLKELAKELTREFGKVFSRSNLQNMRALYLAYPICQTVSGKLSWSHYCELLSISDPDKRSFYEKECEIGDVIDIHFVCRDNYGLGYDFFFQSWKVESEAQDNFGAGGFSSGYDGSEVLRLFWE